jgi:hypothetical protein
MPTNTSFFSSVVERGIAAMQLILRSLFRSREGAVLLLLVRNAASSRQLIESPFNRHRFAILARENNYRLKYASVHIQLPAFACIQSCVHVFVDSRITNLGYVGLESI